MEIDIYKEFTNLTTTPQELTNFEKKGSWVIIIETPAGDFATFHLIAGYTASSGTYSYSCPNSNNVVVTESPTGTFLLEIADYTTGYKLIINTSTGEATLQTASGTATGITKCILSLRGYKI